MRRGGIIVTENDLVNAVAVAEEAPYNSLPYAEVLWVLWRSE
jgi:hypothetical protein